MVSGDIRGVLLYLYENSRFKPTTITSALSGLKRFLSFYPDIKHLIMELPTRLPRERKIIEIYNSPETNAISEILSDGSLYVAASQRRSQMNKPLSDLLNEFIEYKNQNGYAYSTAKYHLEKYLAFSTSHAPEENIPSKDTVNTFLNRYASTPGNLYNIAAALRELSRYLIGLAYTSTMSRKGISCYLQCIGYSIAATLDAKKYESFKVKMYIWQKTT